MRQKFSLLARVAAFLPLLSILLLPVGPVLAVGASPSEIFIPSLLRGAPQSSSIILMRSNGQVGDLRFQVSASGDGAQYLKFEPAATLPAEKAWMDYSFQIDPGLAQTGDYEAKLQFVNDNRAPGEATAEGVISIIMGVSVKVHFTVSGDEVVAFDIISSVVADTESGMNPFVSYVFANKGNVNWRPMRAELTFADSADSLNLILATLESDAFGDVPPGITKTEQIKVPLLLPEGAYVLATKFYGKDGVVGELVAREFNVFAPGTMLQTGELVSVTTRTKSFDLGEKILVDGIFKNTGTVPIVAAFMTEVFKGDAYLDLIRGEEVTVDAGSEASFSQIVELGEPGDYVLSSHVRFANKKTAKQDVAITVVGKESLSFVNSPAGIAAISVGILLLAGAFVGVRKMRARGSRKAPPPVNPVEKTAAEVLPPESSPMDSPPRW